MIATGSYMMMKGIISSLYSGFIFKFYIARFRALIF